MVGVFKLFEKSYVGGLYRIEATAPRGSSPFPALYSITFKIAFTKTLNTRKDIKEGITYE